jgi:hypothetical protein
VPIARSSIAPRQFSILTRPYAQAPTAQAIYTFNSARVHASLAPLAHRQQTQRAHTVLTSIRAHARVSYQRDWLLLYHILSIEMNHFFKVKKFKI